MKTGFILSLHQMRGGSEALIFDMDGQVRSGAYAESNHHCSGNGWLELDPEEICAAAMRAIADALEVGGIMPKEVRAIGIINESDAIVLWERVSGRPIGRSIIQLGDESLPRCDDLQLRRIQKMTREATGLTTVPCCFAGYKLCWMLNAQPDLRGRAEHREIACGTLDSWLIYRLTGGKEHITDLSNALRTQLYDTQARAWNRQLLELLGIPPGILPEVRPLSEGYGETASDAFFGIPGIPLAGLAEHQKAGLFG